MKFLYCVSAKLLSGTLLRQLHTLLSTLVVQIAVMVSSTIHKRPPAFSAQRGSTQERAWSAQRPVSQMVETRNVEEFEPGCIRNANRVPQISWIVFDNDTIPLRNSQDSSNAIFLLNEPRSSQPFPYSRVSSKATSQHRTLPKTDSSLDAIWTHGHEGYAIHLLRSADVTLGRRREEGQQREVLQGVASERVTQFRNRARHNAMCNRGLC